MKKLVIVLLLIAGSVFSQTQYRLNVNKINLPMNNKGILAAVNISDPNPIISGPGGKYGGHIFLFSGGFLLAGYADDTLWANGVAYSSSINDYLPGTVNNEPTDPKNIIYVVKKNDAAFGQSWQDWINAVELGADFYDGNNDGVYNPTDLNGNNIWDPSEDKPAIMGDEMTWCVYNDKVPANQRRFNTVTPKGIVIQQTVLAFATNVSPLGNTIFIRYRLINTGTVVSKLDSVIFAIYTDPDLGFADDDLTGCDTLLNSGFVYNDGPDGEYGAEPPAFFMKYLQGPVAYIPGETFIDNNSNNIFELGIDTPLDTAYNRKGNLFNTQSYPGAKNLRITSHTMMVYGDPTLNHPQNFMEAANYINGLNQVGAIIDPCVFTHGTVKGGVNCSEVNPYLWFSGDPVSDIGWIETTAGDHVNMVSTGKFTLEANKPIDIWVGYVVGQGYNALNSLSVTKNYTQDVQTYFNDNFTNGIVSDLNDNEYTPPEKFSLFQNYPNPFNPSTTISWQSPLSGWQTLKIFNTLGQEVETIVNEYLEAGFHSKLYIVNSALPSGVYYYQLRAGNHIETRKMIYLK
ncbi:MAG: T9SS type A sorting domain-containing protein [Ignavibacteriaceae bacterium]|jgi:hypothetical protein|nr:T9SS type A sorting domain-containing protein [Ignavibacteriaceae bacterium]